MTKTALVLGGGGSRGSYQIGVWQGLEELSIKLDIVTGTSVGALNAALIAMNDFDNALNIWENMTTGMVLDVELDEELSPKKKVSFMVRQFLKDYAKQGGTDSYPLKQLLDKHCDEETIRNSEVECGIVVVDKKTLKSLELYVEDIEEGKLTEYLLASSSLYPAIKCCPIGDTEYIDGGYYDNLPVELATKKNADRVIAVDLEAIGIVRRNTLKLAKKLILIKSYWDLGPILVFDHEIIAHNIRLGYLDTMKAFGAFDGIAYTFIKNEVQSLIRRIRDEIEIQNHAIGITYDKNMTTQKERLFHLQISNHLTHKYSREYDVSYTSFFKACMESAGEIFELDSEKIYSIEVFNQKLTQKINELSLPETDPVEFKSITQLKSVLSLFEKNIRTFYMGTIIKKAVLSNRVIDILGFALILPDELLAAYYIALIS